MNNLKIPTMNNPVYAARSVFVSFLLCCLLICSQLSAQQVSVQSTDTKTGTDFTTHSLTNVPAGALLVVTTTCQYGTVTESITSTPSLTWAKRVEATSTGAAKIYTAVFSAGGSISVKSDWGSNRYQSSVCYVVQNQESTLGGATATGASQDLPNVNITTTRNNSIIFCATSDWNAGSGTITYRGSATPAHTANSPTAAAFYHYRYAAATAGTFTVGLISPSMEEGGASTAVLEIRSPVADATPPSAPVIANNPAIASTSIGITWSASTDNVGVSGYEVYVGGVLHGTATNTDYSITGLTASTQYSIYVRAKDAAGNGTNSSTVQITTSSANTSGWGLGGNTGTNASTNFIGTTDGQGLAFKTNNLQRILISADGNVGIGTSAIIGGTYKLYVESGIRTRKVKVDISNWPDYVFEKKYRLPSLDEIEAFINKNKHLPGVPSANEVEEKGLDLGGNQAVLLQKIEELTLYIIGQNKESQQMKTEITELKEEIGKIKAGKRK